MAERRMFAKTIIDSDLFLDMPLTTQLLYFHLSMRADDDGFINNPKRILRTVGCGDDDLKILITNALKLLTDKEQQTFIDIYANSHTYQQVADLYGCSKGTVQSYINRAKKKISTAIKEGAISQ